MPRSAATTSSSSERSSRAAASPERASPTTRNGPGGRGGRGFTARARYLALLAVAVAALGGVLAATALVDDERDLSVGAVRVGVSPFHHGALDIYVPIVDWGARFDGVRLPARLTVEVRSVDREVAERVATGSVPDVQAVRHEMRGAIEDYLRTLLAIAFAAGLALGALVALAVRGRAGPRVRTGVITAAVTSLAAVAAIALLLPPRGRIDDPEYYARGADIPRALDALQSLRRSRAALDQELNGQLVGLARLVVAPGERAPLAGRPRLVLASDLHNNILALPALERAARGLPLVFAGDLTDRGTPIEAALVRRVARAGRPVVVVGGNHDSDTLLRELARDGAVVLTERGRLRADGSHGEMVVNVGGLRMAGFTDPSLRLAGQEYEDRFRTGLTIAGQEAFRRWIEPLLGKVDVIVVHDPAIAQPVVDKLREDPPARPVTFLAGHTHHAGFSATPGILEVNGGTIGAGGTGNLAEGQDLGLALVTYREHPTPLPLAVDLVQIDPKDGSATARRTRVDRDLRAAAAR